MGRWSGLTRAQIKATDSALLERFESGDPDVRPGEGESRRDLSTRVRGAVNALAAENPAGRIALVVHAGVIRALVPRVALENAEIIEIGMDDIHAFAGGEGASGQWIL